MQTDPALPQDARTWAMLCHLSALVGLFGNGLGFVVGPLIVWLIKRKDHPFIDEQGKEALNFQITVFVLIVILTLVPVAIFLLASPIEVTFGMMVLIVLLGAALAVADLVLTVVASVKANAGERYRYPFSFRFIA